MYQSRSSKKHVPRWNETCKILGGGVSTPEMKRRGDWKGLGELSGHDAGLTPVRERGCRLQCSPSKVLARPVESP